MGSFSATMAKTKTTPAAAAAAAELPDEVIDKVVLLLITARSRADVRTTCIEKLELSAFAAAAAMTEAARRINLAAQCDFDAELGAAKQRLADLYQRSVKIHDCKTALAVQRELSKLLALYQGKQTAAATEAAAPTEDSEELEAVRAHLAPLVNATEDEPTHEIARRVVALFTVTRSGLVPEGERTRQEVAQKQKPERPRHRPTAARSKPTKESSLPT